MSENFINTLDTPLSVKQQLRKITGRDVEQLKNKIFEIPEVKSFLKEYEEILDEKIINRSMRALLDFKNFANDPVYQPRLRMYCGNIDCVLEQRPEALKVMQKEKWKMKLDLTRVSKDNRQANFTDYDMSEVERLNAFTAVYEIVKNYDENKKNVGIWLTGDMGIGKSYLLAATAKELNAKGAGVTMIGVNELIEEYKSQMGNDSDNKQKVIDKAKLVDVLILDDIGAETVTDFTTNTIMFPILDWRYKKEKLTMFTSNLSKGDYTRLLLKPKNSTLSDVENKQNAKRMMTRIDALAREVQTSGKNRREYY